MREENFGRFFQQVTGEEPYPYQLRLATQDPLPDLLHLPTGSGKTYAVVAAWLWRLKFEDEGCIPRRLVYCLPVRVLVEQTYRVIKEFVEKAGFPDIHVYKLMGGDVEEEWRYHPEEGAVIVGTQDMLLSRALNRGFAQSRFSWPLAFALLNNDCLWVFDEVQLMGSGLATSTQLAAFREIFGTYGKCKSIWMSATLDPEWLKTVDFRGRAETLEKAELGEEDLGYERLAKRMESNKILRRYEGGKKPRELARFLKEKHRSGTITLAVFNTVDRAVDFYKNLRKTYGKDKESPDVVLIHSRFRGAEREEKERIISDELIPPQGRIIVSTQVVEAGVDLSAATLFTELAPWPSIVQRLGRCNRYGEFEKTDIFWVDLEEKNYPPYEKEDMEQSRRLLLENEGKCVSPSCLRSIAYRADPNYRFVIRRKDIQELFDTTPDLTGDDIDVSRFIRDAEALDLQVFWRDFDDEPHRDLPSPSYKELCPVPYWDFRKWLGDKNKKEGGNKTSAYVWDFMEAKWIKAEEKSLRPGALVLLPCKAGGYDRELGWHSRVQETVDEIDSGVIVAPESTSLDQYMEYAWITLEKHSMNVKEEMTVLLDALSEVLEDSFGTRVAHAKIQDILQLAALLHDIGKASEVFQAAFLDVPEDCKGKWLAKGKMRGGKFPYARKYFRHELVSALLILQNRDVLRKRLGNETALNALAYLVAAHHGKVRCAVKALPVEEFPDDGRRFALGVWEGDVVDELRLDDLRFPRTELSLSCMELGCDENGGQSWIERCLGLLDEFGPFRLAYLETLVRCADARASMREVARAENS